MRRGCRTQDKEPQASTTANQRAALQRSTGAELLALPELLNGAAHDGLVVGADDHPARRLLAGGSRDRTAGPARASDLLLDRLDELQVEVRGLLLGRSGLLGVRKLALHRLCVLLSLEQLVLEAVDLLLQRLDLQLALVGVLCVAMSFKMPMLM